MLHGFHHSELFITYTKENMTKVQHLLDLHGIDYTLKTTRVQDVYTDEDILSGGKETSDDRTVAYKVYVHLEDMEEAQRLVKEALFPYQ